MTTRKTRGGTFGALGIAASNLLVPLGLFYGVKYQQSRVARSRQKHRRKTRRS